MVDILLQRGSVATGIQHVLMSLLAYWTGLLICIDDWCESLAMPLANWCNSGHLISLGTDMVTRPV